MRSFLQWREYSEELKVSPVFWHLHNLSISLKSRRGLPKYLLFIKGSRWLSGLGRQILIRSGLGQQFESQQESNLSFVLLFHLVRNLFMIQYSLTKLNLNIEDSVLS